MQVISTAKNVRVSPEKVRLVVAQIKKMAPAKAIEILEFVPNKSSKPLKKVIMSAMADAKNNFNLDESSLAFAEINVGKGISFKRFRPISRGRAHAILKKTSIIRVTLNGEKIKKIEKQELTPKIDGEKIKSNEAKEKGKK